MNHRMAVCDHEEQYMYHLTEYLEKREVFPFTIHSFTSITTLKKYACHHEISLLLISEDLWEEDILSWYKGKILILDETGSIKEREEWLVYKYQSSENIYQRILSICMESGIRLPTISASEKRMKIIGFYTPVHRCLQTSFSLCLGQILSKRSKVLYLNLESYSGFSYLMKDKPGGNLTDILYLLGCDENKLGYQLGHMTGEWKGLEYIVPFAKGLDVRGIPGEEWLELIAFLGRKTEYEYLILDLGEQTQKLFDLLSACDVILTISRQDEYARAKLRQYEDSLKMIHYENLLLKTKKIDLPFFRQLSGEIQQLPYGELAAYIRRMITEEGFCREIIKEDGV